MFKKAKRSNLRRRNESDEDEKEESQPAQQPCGPFAEDLPMPDAPSTDAFSGAEVFRVKKSNHSKKIVKQLKKEYKEDLEKVCYVKQEPNT
ncbi:unnamed protein product, partial [Coregonus sp. 'balchen']